MAILAPNIFKQYFDNSGQPLNAGYVECKDSLTSAGKDVWGDVEETVNLGDTVTLSSTGRTKFYLESGTYDFYIYDSDTNLIDTVTDVPGSTSGGSNSNYILDTIAELKAVPSPNESITYQVNGYYAAGDNRVRFFEWDADDTTTDNGGTVIQLSAGGTGRFNDLNDGVINAKDFGATGDGETDDTTFINATLAAHETVELTDGSYVISASLILDDNSTFFAKNNETCKLVVLAASAGTDFAMVSATTKNNWTVRNIGFDNSANYPDDTTTVPNENVYLNDAFTFAVNDGIKAISGGDDITIEGCRFLGTSGHGIHFEEVDGSTLSYNRVNIINNNFFNGSYTRKVIAVYGHKGGTDNSTQVVITGNISRESSVTKYLTPGVNTQNASTDGIHVDHVENFVISNNTVFKPAGNGIRIEQSLHGSVDSNVVEEAGSHGISVYNSSFHVTVSNNTVKKWGRIPNFGSLRYYSGDTKFYFAREYQNSTLPADPSATEWFEENIYYSHVALANLPGGTVPTYATGGYVGSGDFSGLDHTVDANYSVSNEQGVFPNRGWAGISVSEGSEKVLIIGNTITGDLTQTGGLYNYQSDYGITTVHIVNGPDVIESPMMATGNIISGYIREAIYQPPYEDPILQNGQIDAIFKYKNNYYINANDELQMIAYDDDIKTHNNHQFAQQTPRITFTKASSGYLTIDGSSRPVIGTGEFGMLMQVRFTAALPSGVNTRLFDSGEGETTVAGFAITCDDNTLDFQVKDGSSNEKISTTRMANWGTAPNDMLTIYVARDASGMRMTVISDNSITNRHVAEVTGSNGGAFDVDVAGAPCTFGVDTQLGTPYAPMELYKAIIWDEAFTSAEILSRIDEKPLIKADDSVIFDLDMRSCGYYFLDKSETSKIIYASGTGIQSSYPYPDAFACDQKNVATDQWFTNVNRAVLPSDFVITGIIAETAGTPDIQVGDTFGGAELVAAATTLVAGKNFLTLLKNFSDTNKISVTSDDTSLIKWSVLGYRARY